MIVPSSRPNRVQPNASAPNAAPVWVAPPAPPSELLIDAIFAACVLTVDSITVECDVEAFAVTGIQDAL